MSESILFENALKASKAFEMIRNDFSSGLGHAYMVVSSDDDVVNEFFTLVACTILCKNKSACQMCPECLKVLHQNHADVFFVDGNKEPKSVIKVERVSDIISSMSVKALGDKKLYFISRADLMNVQAQNKLLKTLEEPPRDVTIFLGVANESAMLDTIKSRTRTINLDFFDESVIASELEGLDIDSGVAKIAASCAEGMLGKALKIAKSQEYAALYDDALYLVENLNRSSDILKVSQRVVSQKDFRGFLDVLSIIIRDMLVAKTNQDMVLSRHLNSKIQLLSAGYSARALAEILTKINGVRRKISVNVNQVACVDDLLFSILEVRHKWQ